MKKISLLLTLFMMVLRGFCQPQITNLIFPTSVNLFEIYELSFSMGSYTNPYDPDVIDVYAVFTGPDNSTHTVNGFYYEGYTFQLTNGFETATADPTTNGWRIRFTPEVLGRWNIAIHAIDSGGETVIQDTPINRLSFTCLPVTDGDGFISVANSRYLKRDVVRHGQRYDHSFFPIGPNIAWYDNLNGNLQHPYGIYYYEKYIDSLDGRGNYMRIWINRFESINLFGPEYTQQTGGTPVVYFNNTLNQKDAAELDHIITYASQHHVAVMLSFFTFGCFKYLNDIGYNTMDAWENNPFNTILNSPGQFFTDDDGLLITKNLIRYIVARWGYATNLLCWEFWNEVDKLVSVYHIVEQDVIDWHSDMADYVHGVDPFHHCISTSSAGDNNQNLYPSLYKKMDFVQEHRYGHIQNAESSRQVTYSILKAINNGHTQYPPKPVFMGEFGFNQNQTVPSNAEKDPFGVNLHNSLWASLFSTSIGAASSWWWQYINSNGLYKHFAPLLNFTSNLPILSDSFTPCCDGVLVMSNHTLVFTNNLQTYYMKNAVEDTIIGWSQDTAFAYQSLRWLTDSTHLELEDWGSVLRFKAGAVFDPLGYIYTLSPSKKPCPSSNSNTITLTVTNQTVGSRYLVKWYNSETGAPLNTGTLDYAVVQQDPQGNKSVSIQFPSIIRDLQQQTINNKYGDVVFMLLLDYLPSKQEIMYDLNND